MILARQEALARANWMFSHKYVLEQRYMRVQEVLAAAEMIKPEVLKTYLLNLELARADLITFLNIASPDQEEDDL